MLGTSVKKTSLALILTLILFSTVFVVSQTLRLVRANPGWRPWEHEISYPTTDVVSPIGGKSYPSNHIWLNFTVAKPSDWLNKTDCFISYVTYCVDGDANGQGRGWTNEEGVIYTDENEVIVYVQDYGSAVKSSYSFSFNLEGLAAGKHTLEVCVEGNYEGTSFSAEVSPRISFTVYPSSLTQSPTPRASPTPTPIHTATPDATSEPAAFPATLIFVLPIGIALAVMSYLAYLKKRKSQKM